MIAPTVTAAGLLALLEALTAGYEVLLKLHARSGTPVTSVAICPAHSPGRSGGAFMHDVIGDCADCVRTQRYVCVHCRHHCPDNDEWPCPTVQEITAALTAGAAVAAAAGRK